MTRCRVIWGNEPSLSYDLVHEEDEGDMVRITYRVTMHFFRTIADIITFWSAIPRASSHPSRSFKLQYRHSRLISLENYGHERPRHSNYLYLVVTCLRVIYTGCASGVCSFILTSTSTHIAKCRICDNVLSVSNLHKRQTPILYIGMYFRINTLSWCSLEAPSCYYFAPLRNISSSNSTIFLYDSHQHFVSNNLPNKAA